MREPLETLSACCLRHQKESLCLREAGLGLPDLLGGWHLLSRGAVPKRQEPSVEALCHNNLTFIRLWKPRKTMYGGDSVADARDISRAKVRALKTKEEDTFFGDDEGTMWDDDEWYFR